MELGDSKIGLGLNLEIKSQQTLEESSMEITTIYTTKLRRTWKVTEIWDRSGIRPDRKEMTQKGSMNIVEGNHITLGKLGKKQKTGKTLKTLIQLEIL